MTALRLALVVVAVSGVAACASRPVRAPVVDRALPRAAAAAPKPAPVAPAPQAAPEGFYLVKRGDTLYSIALEHGADYREVAQWNTLDDPTRIRVGQLLRVKPPEDRAVQVGPARIAGRVESRPLESTPAQAKGDGGTKTEPKALRLPYSKENLAAAAREEPKLPATSAIEGIELVWPTRGKLIGGFAESKSKGIDIGGNLGDPVVAAAPGKVIWVGSGIPGYGKFIVIKHANEVSTVYAHTKEILVKLDQVVSRGQKIAELGNTDAERPKLHFQLRKFGRTVDPLLYLPKS